MNNFFIALSLLFFSEFISAQTNHDLTNRLLEKYSNEELAEIKSSDPDLYKFLEYSLDHAFYFVDQPKEKDFSHRIKGEVIIDDVKDFNFLLLDITFLENDYQYFTVKDKNVLLVVKSIAHLSKEME